MSTPEDRYPVDEALRVVEQRVAGGATVLGFDGFWVDDDGVRPDLDHIADFGSGLQDLDAIVAAVRTWPREDGFCVEIVFAT